MSGPDDSNLFVWDIFYNHLLVFTLWLCVTGEHLDHQLNLTTPMAPSWEATNSLTSTTMIRKTWQGKFSFDPQVLPVFGSFSFYYWIHLRDWHGGDGQHHDLFAGLVSVEGGPRIPLISESIFEVALCLKRIHSSTMIFSQHSGQEPLNVVVTDKGGRYDSWNLLQVNSFFNSILILSSRWKIRWPHRPRWFTLSSCL